MERQDDTTLTGDLVFFRRIPPWGGRVQWVTEDMPLPSSQNFRDRNDELSVYIAKEVTADEVLQGHEGFGLVQFTAEQVRAVFADFGRPAVICHPQEDDAKGHVVICGKISGGMANRLKTTCQWVHGRHPAKGHGHQS